MLAGVVRTVVCAIEHSVVDVKRTIVLGIDKTVTVIVVVTGVAASPICDIHIGQAVSTRCGLGCHIFFAPNA